MCVVLVASSDVYTTSTGEPLNVRAVCAGYKAVTPYPPNSSSLSHLSKILDLSKHRFSYLL